MKARIYEYNIYAAKILALPRVKRYAVMGSYFIPDELCPANGKHWHGHCALCGRPLVSNDVLIRHPKCKGCNEDALWLRYDTAYPNHLRFSTNSARIVTGKSFPQMKWLIPDMSSVMRILRAHTFQRSTLHKSGSYEIWREVKKPEDMRNLVKALDDLGIAFDRGEGHPWLSEK